MPEVSDDLFIPAGQQHPDSAIPRFHKQAVKNNWRSDQEGKPVYDSKDYVMILVPGDRLTVVDRQVTDADKARWPRYWAAYEKGQEFTVEGTPLEQWTLIDIGMVETLKYFNVRSVEQIAKMTDAQVQRVGMGMSELRQKAKVWCAQADENKGVSQVVAENVRLGKELEQLKEQMATLARDAAEATRKAAAAAVAPAPAAAAPAIDPAMLQQIIAAEVAKLAPKPAAPPEPPAAPPPPPKPAPAPAPASALEDAV